MADPDVSGRRSGRAKKRKLDDGSREDDGKQYRKCEKAGCPAARPVCFANASDRCVGGGYTSRWYHLSDGEHFCNECFDHFYRSHKDGHEIFSKWKYEWSSVCQKEASLKLFMAEEVMPYWTQCKKCSKWRELEPSGDDYTPDKLQARICKDIFHGTKVESGKKNACELPEDERVKSALDDIRWVEGLMFPPLLKRCVDSSLLESYFPDGVGLSSSALAPTKAVNGVQNSVKSKGLIKPFYDPDKGGTAQTVRPDVIEPDEMKNFAYLSKVCPGFFITLRNLVLMLWSDDCKDVVSVERCTRHMIVRGLVRISLIAAVQEVIDFLTMKGLINHGAVKAVPEKGLLPAVFEEISIVVIGSGVSGLAAARQLKNFGAKVTVLEGRDRIGGRVWDDRSLDAVVGTGAQILNGSLNNPISVLCEQVGATTRVMGHRCDLYTEGGKIVDSDLDSRVEFHFNALLDAVAEWKKTQDTAVDVPLGDKMTEMHKRFVEETSLSFNEQEQQLLDFHLGNLEYACAANLKHVSALYWDQNETFPQFTGSHVWLPGGYGDLLTELAKGLDIQYKTEVSEVDYSGDKVIVKDVNGRQWIANKVVATFPLAVLKSNIIKFTPSLPDNKLAAIDRLGAGTIEKIALRFPTCFWRVSVDGADYFGHVPTNSDQRGFFGLFYDVSPKMNGKGGVLMTVVSGDAAERIANMKDQEVVDMCVETLKKMFKDQVVPEPSNYFVTRWRSDKFTQMSYSYVTVGSTGEDYDIIAEPLKNKVLFAGEATNRQFPQTVTGAYLSGVREAARVVRLCEDEM